MQLKRRNQNLPINTKIQTAGIKAIKDGVIAEPILIGRIDIQDAIKDVLIKRFDINGHPNDIKIVFNKEPGLVLKPDQQFVGDTCDFEATIDTAHDESTSTITVCGEVKYVKNTRQATSYHNQSLWHCWVREKQLCILLIALRRGGVKEEGSKVFIPGRAGGC